MTPAPSARGLFRATGNTARPVMLGIEDGQAVMAEAIPREANDFYPTPPDPTRAILSAELPHLQRYGHIWEPAAGDGAMVREIESVGLTCTASDLIDRGAGAQIRDFYDFTTAPARAILTNPPFAECNTGRWITHAMGTLGIEYMALLLPLGWPGAAKRAALWATHTPARVYLMRWKIDFTGQGAPPMLNAWFVWDATTTGPTELHMLDRDDARQGALF